MMLIDHQRSREVGTEMVDILGKTREHYEQLAENLTNDVSQRGN